MAAAQVPLEYSPRSLSPGYLSFCSTHVHAVLDPVKAAVHLPVGKAALTGAVLCADGTADAARANLALLRAIPSMAVHSAALPFTLRVLQQLCPPGGLP